MNNKFMVMDKFILKNFLTATFAGATCFGAYCDNNVRVPENELPNILWIVSEDNSPMLGCYGDKFATTPNIDKFASEGVLYLNAFANAPVSAPARATIITGMYANSLGSHHMRSRYQIPAFIQKYPEILRDAGYYCSNRSKTDFNIAGDDKSIWDESSNKASYKNRKAGQPFFSIINLTTSHESSIHKLQLITKHDTARVQLPPYHPDTPELRHDWALYYDKVEAMDIQVGEILDELVKDRLSDNTIVFYYSDHGGILCRSKRYLYDSGTHVPMIIRFPEKYKHLAPGMPGTKTDRMVSFVDLAPTLLSLSNITIPDYIQGKAFLGEQQENPPEYVYLFRGRMDERIDMMRAVRDKKFKYIHNYMPHRIYGQHLEYLWKPPSTRSWETEFLAGRCNQAQSIFWQTKPTEELYDITKDPWEVNNLASDPSFKKVLERMRGEVNEWVRDIRDPGFLPEGEMIKQSSEGTSFELVRNSGCPIEEIINIAEIASEQSLENIPVLLDALNNEQASVRYWAVTGLAILGTQAKQAENILLKVLIDKSPDVSISAAEALCNIGREEETLSVLVSELKNKNSKIALHAANVLCIIGSKAKPVLSDLISIESQIQDNYVKRALNYTIGKLQSNLLKPMIPKQ